MRSTTSTTVRRVTLLGLSVLLVGACAQPDNTVKVGARSVEDRVSELASFPGFGSSPVLDERRYDEEALLREKLIASCMRAVGQDYVVAAPDATASDPNEAAARAMKAEARTAYYMALYGVDDPNDPSLGAAEERKNGGCLGYAHRRLPGIFRVPGELRAAKDALDEERDALRQRTYEDCMSAAGIDTDALRSAPLDASAGQKSVNQRCVTDAMVPSEEILRLEANFVRAHRSELTELTAHRDAQLEAVRKQVGSS